MVSKQKQILELFTKEDLVKISRDLGFKGWAVLNKEEIIDRLSKKGAVPVDEILAGLKISGLRLICVKLKLNAGGQKKQVLIDRIVGKETRPPQPASKHTEIHKHKIQSAVNPKPLKPALKQSNDSSPPALKTESISLHPLEKIESKKKSGAQMNNFQDKANFIWQVADDILRGTFKQHEYGDVILPFVLLRRLDCVLNGKKDAVIQTHQQFKNKLPDTSAVLLQATGGLRFYNTSLYDLQRLTQDSGAIEANFDNYLNGFSKNVRDIIDNFGIEKIVTKLAKNGLLLMLVDKFTEIDLHPDLVSNHEMGYIFEELLRRFSEMSNETAGEHYTPREVIRLMVNLLFAEHRAELKGKGIVRSVYDPACGTGGMLTIARDYIQKHINPGLEVIMFGQELNEQTYAIAKSDVLMTGGEPDNIRLGTSFSNDQLKGKRFDFMLSNPPFGVSWKKEQPFIQNEAGDPNGRFHAGLPRVSDGAMLFLQHMISKMEPTGSRIAIIHNGSPLFTGDAGSGESDIRKWIIESDWLEAIVALPTELFFNTGIATYIWIVTNRKPAHRRGKVQLINAVSFSQKMRKSLGNKRNYITEEQISQVTEFYTGFTQGEYCKIFDNTDFGFTKVTVERPEMKNGKVVKDKSGNPNPDTALRDYEKIPLKEDIDAYFGREVLPHVPDAWMDRGKGKIGYEINFTKYFYRYQPLRSLDAIKADILALEQETEGLLREMTKGLKPNVKMKDSGIEWLGEVPEHWELIKLKHLVAMKSGDSITSESIDESGDYAVYGGNGLRGFTSSFTHDGDFVLIGRQGALCGNVHLVKGKFWASEHAVVVTQKTGHDILWLAEVLRTMNLNKYSESAAQPGISVEKIQNLTIAVPPEKESIEIATHLKSRLAKQQKAIEIIKEKIALFNEYRTTLISDVVTGKIDVRGEVRT